MTEINPVAMLAAGGSKAKIVSLISEARRDGRAAAPRRDPTRTTSDYGEGWYHDAAIRDLKEVH